MDSGLSARMSKALEELLPASAAQAPPENYNAATAIDLATGQNEVIRKELLEFFKTTIESRLTANAFALPDPNGGDLTLRRVLAVFFNTYFKPIHPIISDHIVLTAGAGDAIENVIQAVCDEGDSVIVPGPYWPGFDRYLKARSVNVIAAHPPTYHKYDNYLSSSLQAAYSFASDRAKIRAVILCNPHNPLSRCYPKRAIIECIEFCQERNLHLISDEIYALAQLGGTPKYEHEFVSALSLTEPLMRDGAIKVDPSRVHVVWSASKLFGSSGFRIGCLISQQNPELCSAMTLLTASHTNKIASLYLSSLLQWSQLPTLIALNAERLTESYRLLADAFRRWHIDFVPPTHGIFVFARLGRSVRSSLEEKAFFERLAVQGVRVSPGRFYNGVDSDYGWARLRFSVSIGVMQRAIERISAFLAKEGV